MSKLLFTLMGVGLLLAAGELHARPSLAPSKTVPPTTKPLKDWLKPLPKPMPIPKPGGNSKEEGCIRPPKPKPVPLISKPGIEIKGGGCTSPGCLSEGTRKPSGSRLEEKFKGETVSNIRKK